MSEKTGVWRTPTIFHTTKKLPPELVGRPLWKEMCDDHPELDPAKTERLLARLPKALIDDCMETHLIDFYHDWEAAQGDPRLTLELSAEDEGFYLSVMGESYRGAIACVVAALEGEGYHFASITPLHPMDARRSLQIWPASPPPRPDQQEPPLFVVEAHLAAPLPDGIASAEEATRRLLDRLRPAFALLKRGDFPRALAGAAGHALSDGAVREPSCSNG
jgi:hypothetical protein